MIIASGPARDANLKVPKTREVRKRRTESVGRILSVKRRMKEGMNAKRKETIGHKKTARKGAAFIAKSLLGFLDGACGAYASTCSAIDALVSVDCIDVTLADSSNGAFASTCSACYAGICNLISHNQTPSII